MVTRTWKVYGADGHRQRESFCESRKHDFSFGGKTRIIEVENSDITGTNDYTIARITCDTFEECEREFNGQLSDGIFENSRYGKVEEITEKEIEKMFENYRTRKNMAEVESQAWTKLAEIETEDFSVEGIYNAICAYFGEEFFELDDIENCIKEGWIELCDDGFIIWADMGGLK